MSGTDMLRIGRYLPVIALLSVFTVLFGERGVAKGAERPDFGHLADAVYKAEGGDRASVPYGLIYSSWCMDEPGWCRYYAKEILRIHYDRWLDAGRPGDWLVYVGSRYAPPAVHQLNTHWVKNVRSFYESK